MDTAIIIGITLLVGAILLSAVAQRQAPPAPVVYIKAEPLERREGDGGLGLLLFVVIVLGAMALL